MTDNTFDNASWDGAAVYTPAVLKLYDWVVLTLSNRFVWNCPTERIVALYRQNVSADHHVDIGPGTGYFLGESFRGGQLTLVDLNPNSLNMAAKRLGGQPRPTLLHRDVLRMGDPLACNSVGIGYVLHCLPGQSLGDKLSVFKKAQSWLDEDGVLFGTTVLGRGAAHSLLAKLVLRLYNALGIFSNFGDRADDLTKNLAACFAEYSVEIVGSVALFRGSKPRKDS